MQQTHVKALMVGEKPIVQVALLEDGKELISLPVEVEENAFLDAAKQGIEVARALVGKSAPRVAEAPQETDCEVGPKAADTATEASESKEKGHEFPHPDDYSWESRNSGKGVPTAVRDTPREIGSGEVSNGLIAVLKDACDSEGIEYKTPRSNAEAKVWIRQVREEGVRVLQDLDEAEEAEEVEEVSHG
jgi:hypothetical protein